MDKLIRLGRFDFLSSIIGQTLILVNIDQWGGKLRVKFAYSHVTDILKTIRLIALSAIGIIFGG